MDADRPQSADPAEAPLPQLPPQLESDIAALRRQTAVGLLSLERTAQTLHRPLPTTTPRTEGGLLMNLLLPLRNRPRTSATLAGCALTVGLLLFPVSYDRVSGHTVTVHLHPKSEEPAVVRALAKLTRQALHPKSLQARLSASPGQPSELTLTASVPVRSRPQVEKLTRGLLDALHQQEPTATVEVVPELSRTAGRVYAMALDKLIRINVDPAGKSDSQVADEVRAQLESSGVHAPTVNFARHGDQSSMQIDADVDGRNVQLRREVHGGSDGAVTLEFGGIDDTREPGMSDADLRGKILRQLAARGVPATVTVSGDRIEIRAEHHLDTP